MGKLVFGVFFCSSSTNYLFSLEILLNSRWKLAQYFHVELIIFGSHRVFCISKFLRFWWSRVHIRLTGSCAPNRLHFPTCENSLSTTSDFRRLGSSRSSVAVDCFLRFDCLILQNPYIWPVDIFFYLDNVKSNNSLSLSCPPFMYTFTFLCCPRLNHFSQRLSCKCRRHVADMSRWRVICRTNSNDTWFLTTPLTMSWMRLVSWPQAAGKHNHAMTHDCHTGSGALTVGNHGLPRYVVLILSISMCITSAPVLHMYVLIFSFTAPITREVKNNEN